MFSYKYGSARRRDFGTAFILYALFLALYTALRQQFLEFDSSVFVTEFFPAIQRINPHHQLFGPMVWLFLKLGALLGFDPLVSGAFLSAFFMSLAVAAFYLLLRRFHVSGATAVVYALLLGCNTTCLANGTIVELYAPLLFFMMLALHCFLSEVATPALKWRTALAACLLVVLLLHQGYGLVVLSAYLALMWRDRRIPRRIGEWVALGAVSLAVVLAWLVSEGYFTQAEIGVTRWFFKTFWATETYGRAVWPLFQSPVFVLAIYAGLVLFPAAAAIPIMRREHRDFTRFACIAAILIWGIYSYWVPDRGEFFLPLHVIGGVFAAVAFDRLAAQLQRRAFLLLLLAGCLFYVAFVFFPYGLIGIPFRPLTPRRSFFIFPDVAPLPSPRLAFIMLLFVAANVALLFLGKRAAAGAAATPAPRRAFISGALFLFLVLNTGLPEWLEKRKPDDLALYYSAFRRGTPPDARLLSHDFRSISAALTRRETLAPLSAVSKFKRRQNAAFADKWITEAARPGSPPVYITHPVYVQRRELWEEFKLSKIPLSRLQFRPHHISGNMFYKIEEKTHGGVDHVRP